MPKPSFRQVGRAATTDVRPSNRAPLRAERYNVRTANPSIPSKFAKVPYSPPRKNKSFGSSASRFQRTGAHANPGPGYYLSDKATSLVKKSKSMSYRGLGNGFASKSRRFDRMPLDRINFPAPGQYSQTAATPSFNTQRRAVTASSFRSKTARCNYMDAFKRDAPAPGTYSLIRTKQKKAKITASTFKSRSKRCNYMDELIRDSPAPGAYDPVLQSDLRKSTIRHAAFRSKGPRLPEWGTSVPGPGEYNPVKPHMKQSKFSAAKGATSSFANTNVDRFGTPYDRRVAVEGPTPGPGAYAPQYKKQKPKKITSSWAKSSVARGLQRRKNPPPGPTYYGKPNKPTKQSFHLNRTGAFT